MREIGGYFGLEDLINNEYYKDLISLNSGRNALLYLLQAKNIKKIHVPYYLCDSVLDMLIKNKVEIEYYKIDSKFNPIMDKQLFENEYLYIVNYYGQINNDNVLGMKKKFKNIILDNTHAFFQQPVKGIDTIYSCRKFFGVPDGAYLYTENKIKKELDLDVSKDRMIHILGRYEGNASDYYDIFQMHEEVFKNESIKQMSKLTKNILGAIDYEKVKNIRNENYLYLHEQLGKYNKLSLSTQEGAYSYPFYIENGAEIRKKLISKKIYISMLWPNVVENTDEDSIEHSYAQNILPIPCDQRYCIEDMNYIINIINKFIDK